MDTARSQFEKEAQALVQIIIDMISAGQLAEAGQLLEQYKLLNPADPLIPELREALDTTKKRLERESSVAEISGKDDSGKVTEKIDIVKSDNTANKCPEFLKNTESIYIVSGLGMKRTGVFTSIYGKVKLMEEKLGYNSTILLCRHDIDLKKTEVWLKTFTGTSSILGTGTKILSIYEYFQNSYAEELENKAIYSRSGDDDGLRYEAVSDKTYAVYDADKRVRLDVYTGYSGSLRVERYYDGETVLKEHYYDDWGYLNNIREFKDGDTNKFKAEYFTTGGRLCLSADFDTDKDANEPQKIFMHGENGDVIREFKNNHELAALYFKQVMEAGKTGNGAANDAIINCVPLETSNCHCGLDPQSPEINMGFRVGAHSDKYIEGFNSENGNEKNNNDKFYLLIYEAGTVSEIAGFLDSSLKNYANVTVVHSIFLKNAYDMKSGPQMYYEYVCKHPSLYEGIVLLTRGARRDFNKLYGQHKNTYVIPHPYPYEIERADFEQRDHRKAVVIGRLFPEKQLELTVDIFSMVVKSLPDVKLEIYGTGMEKQKIEDRIKLRKMEESIFLMGYTDDPIAIYRTSALSIMTSLAEGYGLALMESICNGCPAFAHDIKYGPADIIKDKETGFLFPRGDKEKFARQMIKFFEDLSLQKTMSENCYADTPRFGQDVFLQSWLEMAETIYKDKQR